MRAWPLDDPQHLAAALREQATPDDDPSAAAISAAAADLLPLADWAAPAPTPDDTRRLVERLLPAMPQPAAAPALDSRAAPFTPAVAVEQAASVGPLAPIGPAASVGPAGPAAPLAQSTPLAAAAPIGALPSSRPPAWAARPSPLDLASPHGLLAEFWFLLRLVRAQVSLLLPSFWLASILVVALGALLTWAAPSLSRSFVLHVSGPLLAYLGVAQAFRAGGLKMLEFELACPPSPRQLTLARLVVVLAYDLALGLLLSLLLWPGSGAAFWQLSLHWLAPLLLGVGLTLLLSLRLPLAQSAAAAYTGWLALLGAALISQNSPGLLGAGSVLPPALEYALGLAGLALIAAGLALLPRAVPGMLPRGR